MYLLNRSAGCPRCNLTDKFTFHYVSIKSLSERNRAKTTTFTFHYVSIKSEFEDFKKELMNKFTFHYVSIKSRGGLNND